MARAFSRWIRRHPDDHRFILENGYDWTYFQVEDVPFFVRSLHISEDENRAPQLVEIVLSDESREELDLSSLSVGARDAVYCRVKGGEFSARFDPAAQTGLAPLLQEADDGRLVVALGTKQFPVANDQSRRNS
jgi:hypothetical protein